MFDLYRLDMGNTMMIDHLRLVRLSVLLVLLL
jgi:hypothetical protein